MTQEGSIEKVVESAVRAQVQKMMVESLEGVDGLVGRLIAGAMQVKVKDGVTYREIPFIERLCRDAVQEAAQEAMKAWIEENKPALRAEVERQLTAQKKTLAESMVASFGAAAGDQYRIRVVLADRSES